MGALERDSNRLAMRITLVAENSATLLYFIFQIVYANKFQLTKNLVSWSYHSEIQSVSRIFSVQPQRKKREK